MTRRRTSRQVVASLSVIFLCLSLFGVAAPVSAQTTETGTNRSARVEALVRRGEAHRAAGRLREGFADLREAVALASDGPVRRFALAALGAAEAEVGLPVAEKHLQAAIEAGPVLLDAAGAVAAAHLARLLLGRGDLAQAVAFARAAATTPAPPLVSAFAETVAGQVADARGRPDEAEERFGRAARLLDGLPTGHTEETARLGLADALLSGPVLGGGRETFARALLERVAGSPDRRLAAEAGLGRARLARRLGTRDRALAEARTVIAYARTVGADDLLYRAFRLRAEVGAALGRADAALAAYRAAFEALRAVRDDLVGRFDAQGRSLYRLAVADFHRAYVDLLLRESRRSGRDAQALRAEARVVIEDLKVIEVEDYFQERCVAAADPVDIERAADRVAVLYPIVLDDRLELLLSRDGRLESRTSPVGRADLRAIADAAFAASSIVGRPYRTASRRLYEALIAPVADLLDPAAIDTLVYVPDSALRGFPIAALWDGEEFLTERLPVATVLGLGLIPREGAPIDEREALVVGVSETAVAGFEAIPGAIDEAILIADLFGTEPRLGQSFPADEAPAILRRAPYDVVHIAAHAAFGVEPADNFIALSDGPVGIDALVEALRARTIEGGRSIDLLTLSACETARGTDRSPLGLAGAAYRANVRSALASLWLIPDAASALLMVEFYRALDEEGMGRARALSLAQRRFLAANPTLRHPANWGAFLLLGAWD